MHEEQELQEPNPLFRLEITRMIPNPKYAPTQSPYGREEQEYLHTTALTVLVSQEQFEAIRKAVLERF